MAIRYSSSGGTPFGDTSGRPSSPAVGQTYYNGQLGYLEIYTVSGWIPATGANDFSLNVTGTNTTVTFNQTYSSGSYSIVSFLNDASLDIYAYATDGSLAGYTNTKAFTATQRFNKMVILGGSYGDVLQFSYKTTYATSTSTTDITAGPYITSVTPSGMPNKNDTITITGGNFATNVAVAFTGTGYSSTVAKSIVRSSSTQLIVTRPDNFPVSGAPYTVTVTNPSVANQPTGSAVHTYSPITAGVVPVWATSSSQTIPATQAYSLSLSATDADGSSTITYSNVSGTLPTGISFNSNTGVISGTASQAGSFTYVVRATDSGGNTADLTILFTVSYPTITGGTLTSDSTYYYRTFTTNGNLTVSVSQITCDYLIVAGGGGGGMDWYSGVRSSGGGGAGGYRSFTSQTITPNTYGVVIGGGGAGGYQANGTGVVGSNGIASSFNNITSTGGGGGSGHDNSGNYNAGNGGSGGGSTHDTSMRGFASPTGQGYDGGISPNTIGGPGLQWLNGIYYAGGGAGSQGNGFTGAGGGGAGGTPSSGGFTGGAGGGGSSGSSSSTVTGGAGTANTGGGGGASRLTNGGTGGSGVVIIRYTKASVGG